MGHAVSTFVAGKPAIEHLSAMLEMAPIFSVNDTGFWFLPVSDETFDLATKLKGNSAPVKQGYYRFSKALAEVARECSADGPIAHVFTDYFGGDGQQGATAWNAGTKIFGPEVSKRDAINAALRAIGVKAAAPLDAFDTIGLGVVRSNDDFERFASETAPATDPKPSTWIRWLRGRIFPSP